MKFCPADLVFGAAHSRSRDPPWFPSASYLAARATSCQMAVFLLQLRQTLVWFVPVLTCDFFLFNLRF